MYLVRIFYMKKTRSLHIIHLLLILALLVSPRISNAGNVGDWPTRVVRFYPNPASTTITFEFKKEIEKQVNFQVYNFMGKRLVDVPLNGNKVAVNLEAFYRGLYIFQLRDKAGTILESGKFQIVK